MRTKMEYRLNSMDRRKSPRNQLVFQNINVKIQRSHILHDVTGRVNSGEMLAVTGPSGSGKTTLLNSLVGIYPLISGDIKLNGYPIDKATKRSIAYVTQKDIFFSNLTLWDCLFFVAMIRLPDSMTRNGKIERLNYIVDLLDLRKCLHTVIGAGFGPGLSGGEKKRANIGCELLTNPDIMLLDEPTSGLDSFTAAHLMRTLKEFTIESNKTVIVTLHQPSSKVFHMCTSLLLFIEGRNAYFGPANEILTFFESIDLYCDPLYNPADFMLEQCKADKNVTQKIVDAASELRKTPEWAEMFGTTTTAKLGSVKVPLKAHMTGSLSKNNVNVYIEDEEATESKPRDWPTSTWSQYKWISWRWFQHFKKEIFAPLIIIQNAFLIVAVCLLWFQIERSPATIKDRMGFFFALAVYSSFSTLANSIGLFPEELPVFRKERSAGYYKFTAYFFARITSELPLLTVSPVVMFTIQYWVAGLHGVPEYFLSLIMILLLVYFVQALSFLVYAICADFRMSMTLGSIITMYAGIFSGFYSASVPTWMMWAKYLSYMYYPLSFLYILELSDLQDINCAKTSVIRIQACAGNRTATITSDDVLRYAGIDMPVHFYPLVMASAILVLRILGYYTFKMNNKPR